MATMKEIEASTKIYSEARTKMAEIVAAWQEGLDALKKDHLPRVRRQVQRLHELESDLKGLIEQAPELFVKPKTVVLHGVKVGYAKGEGTISWEDQDKVVQLIEKRMPELAEQLIKTTKKPLKGGLEQLTVQQLKSIGCTVEEAGDRVVVRAVDKDVDKLVTALLKGAAVEEPA